MKYKVMHAITGGDIDIPPSAIGITINASDFKILQHQPGYGIPDVIVTWLEPIEGKQHHGRNVAVDLHDILDLLTMYDGGGPMPSDIFDIISDCNIQDVKEYTNKLKAESEEGTADEVLEMFIGYTTDLEMRKHRVIK